MTRLPGDTMADRLFRGRPTSPRAKGVGLVLFALLAGLAWGVMNASGVHVHNASGETLRDLRVCAGERCVTRAELPDGRTWQPSLRAATGEALTFAAGSADSVPVGAAPGGRVRLLVRAPGRVELAGR